MDLKVSLRCLLLGLLLFSGGCASCNDCGTLQQSSEIRELFVNSQIVPTYNYFYNGPVQAPRAIVGIDQRLQVQGRFWNPVELTPEQLSTWVRTIETRPSTITPGSFFGLFEGFEMLDPQGDRIGIWYSFFDWGVFKFPDETTVTIYAPSFRPTTGSFSINNSRY